MDKKVIIILGVLGSSTSAIFFRLAETSSYVMAFYRMLLSALILLPIIILKHRDELKSLHASDYALSILSGVFLGIHFTVYFESLNYTSIASSTTLASTEVFFVAFALAFYFKETINTKSWIGILVAFAGSIVIAFADITSGSNVFKGDLLAVAAGLFLACYTILGKIIRNRNVSTNVYTFIVYSAAALTVFIISSFKSVPLVPVTARAFLCALGTAVFCTILGHSIFSWGLKYIQASYIANAKMLAPVYATIFGLILFGEMPSIMTIVGCIIVILGVIIYSNNVTSN